MNRGVWFILCTVVGLELIAWGLLVPVHIGAVDAKVLQLAGENGPSLAAEGLTMVNLEKSGPARLLLEAAEQTGAPGRERLASALRNFETAQPKLKIWGGTALYLEGVFRKNPPSTNSESRPLIDLLVSQRARDTLMDALSYSRRPGVLEILQTRKLTNTTIFSPVTSPSGQPLDAVIGTTALLFQQDFFASALRSSLQAAVSTANQGGAVQPLESIYLDLLALGKRLNWTQLIDLVKLLPDTNALNQVATVLREQDDQLAVIYSAIHFAPAPTSVSKYLQQFPKTGLKDLTFALGAGGGAARDLLTRQQPIHYPKVRDWLIGFAPVRMLYEPVAHVATTHPKLAFVIKYTLCLLGALLVGRAITYLSPALTEELVQNRSFLTGPQMAIGLCLLSVILFFTESLVTRAAPPVAMPLRIKIPVAGLIRSATVSPKSKVMLDKFSAVSLVTFLVMQATIYVICRMKLAQLRRETLPSKLKLRLLENEEQLFDAGLYFGFVGTVVSLILVSIGIIKPSLMAAYSSTSFGIVFVSILKIVHVRPYRRRLILDAEMADQAVQIA